MSEIDWDDDLSVGVPSIDDQHKQLIALTNSLFQAILEGRGFVVLMDILNELAEYAVTHFDYEEKLMKAYGYPEAELKAHICEHDALKEQVAEYIEKCTAHEVALDVKVFNFLRDWTTDHLIETDMKYKRFFYERGVE